MRTVRSSKTFGFIEINDGTFFKSQVVYDENLTNFQEVSGLAPLSHNAAGMLVIARRKAAFRLKAVSIESGLPRRTTLQKKAHFRIPAHDCLRPGQTHFPPFRIRSVAAYAIHKFFRKTALSTYTPHHHRSDATQEICSVPPGFDRIRVMKKASLTSPKISSAKKQT